MKNYILSLLVAVVACGCMTACDEEYTTYKGPEYVMFSDTLSQHMVTHDADYFTVPFSATVSCDYDRTFAVEIIDEGSNAIEGLHYHLESNTITIPAGKLAGEVRVKGCYDQIEATDSLGFRMRLVMPEQLKWELYEGYDETKVVMYKACPFDVNNFTGWCVLTSMFLRDYPGENASYQRLIFTEAHPTEANTVILRNALFDGYDLKIKFEASDPANPLVVMDEDQVLSDEESVLGWVLGDNHILCANSYLYPSYFNACQSFVELWLEVYVENLGVSVGTIGHFYNVLEWISDEEAERLQREEGM